MSLAKIRKCAEERQKREKRGLATGWSDIKADTAIFIYGDELWTFPTAMVGPLIIRRKYRFEAKIDELRKLGKLMKIVPENANG